MRRQAGVTGAMPIVPAHRAGDGWVVIWSDISFILRCLV